MSDGFMLLRNSIFIFKHNTVQQRSALPSREPRAVRRRRCSRW
jgi:hypothetical protein